MTSIVSRRRLLSTGTAALTLAPSAARAAAPPPVTEKIQGAPDDVDRLTIPTTIDGKGPYRFLVDTGADHTVIADNVAQSLGFARGEDVIVQGITSAIPAQTVQLRNLAFGPVQIESLVTPVLPRADLEIDGYLGLDVIDGRRVVFDFQNHALSIARAESGLFPARVRSDEALVPASGQSGRLTAVNCHVDGVHACAFIDSGADCSIGNSKLFDALKDHDGRDYVGNDLVWLTGVTGAMASGRLTTIGRLKVGRLNFTDSALIISDLPIFDVWGLSDHPAMFLGMNYLKQTSAVTIDYGRKELRFRIADEQPRLTRA
ncbi:MAG: aspartyl protease family protein [Alphaproteobacteria bacterium]|nr:aspartyl protease family protein [Alphaproteobacteria bacterium]MBL6937265.1 aspartyl protease family protein [Alphaproteobacteria bacterium]MBL7096173.1 aspartyl protease family protein [Alphaproteobacteria bacterium]